MEIGPQPTTSRLSPASDPKPNARPTPVLNLVHSFCTARLSPVGSEYRSRSRRIPAARIDATSTSRCSSGRRAESAQWGMSKISARVVAGNLAERGLYCLPTGRRCELTGQIRWLVEDLRQTATCQTFFSASMTRCQSPIASKYEDDQV